MNASDYNHLRETGWRRKLTPVEQEQARDYLAAHPEIVEDWELEAGLNRVLQALPEAVVPSNFTARVLQAVARETAAPTHARKSRWMAWRWSFGWAPRMAMAAILLGVCGLSYHEYQIRSRALMAQDVAQFS